MDKITSSDLAVFFQDQKATPEILQQKDEIVLSVLDGAYIEENAILDCTLATLLNSTRDMPTYHRSMAAYTKIRTEHPLHNPTTGLAERISYQMKYGHNQRAKAYMLAAHSIKFADNANGIQAKQDLLDSLSDVAGNVKVDPVLRQRAFLAGYSQTLDESDQVIATILEPFTKEIDRTLSVSPNVTNKLAQIINADTDNNYGPWKNKPKTIATATFLLSFQSKKTGYLIEDPTLSAQGKDFLSKDKEALDAALDKLEKTNAKAYKKGDAYGSDRYCSYRSRKEFVGMMQETGEAYQIVQTPFATIYMWDWQKSGTQPVVQPE